MGKELEGVSYLTAEEAAAELATTPLRVLMLMREGALAGTRSGGEWLVRRDSLAGCLDGTVRVEVSCATRCPSAQRCACKGG